jgi:hypothetical protein
MLPVGHPVGEHHHNTHGGRGAPVGSGQLGLADVHAITNVSVPVRRQSINRTVHVGEIVGERLMERGAV